MSREIVYTTQFKKDYKRLQKRGYDLGRLQAIITALTEDKPLEKRHKDHALRGEYEGTRDCHILPDWLLIYALMDDTLHLIRTGTHADLFGK